jgi:hypothetical protein
LICGLAGLIVIGSAGLRAQNATGGREPADVLIQGRGALPAQRAVPLDPAGGHTFDFVSAGFEFGGPTITGAPYSAESVTKTVQTLSDGNRIVHENRTTLYRDGQGRTRREQTLGAVGPWAAAGEGHQIIFINDPVANINYVLNPKERTARRIAPPRFMTVDPEGEAPAGEAGVAVNTEVRSFGWISAEAGEPAHREEKFTIAVAPTHQQQMTEPPTTESLGTRAIEGVVAEGTRTTITIPANTIGNERALEIVSERWYSPELQMEVLTRRNDPRFGETTYTLTNIQRSEPSPLLFEVPTDYTMNEDPVAPRIRMFKKMHEKAPGAPE